MTSRRRVRSLLAGSAAALVWSLAAPVASGDAPGNASASPPLADQVVTADHSRMYFDFVEVSVPLAAGEHPQLEVEVAGKSLWSKQLDNAISVFRLGPVIGPTGAHYAITVSRQAGENRHLIAKVAYRDPGRADKHRFAEGGLRELSLTLEPVDVWVVPEIAVVAPGPLSEPSRKLLSAALVDFDRRLVDLSDGQIRIARFAVYEPPLPPGVSETSPGVIRLTPDPTGCGKQRGRPRQPAVIPLFLDPQAGPDRLGAILAHRFGHAYLGLEDEARADGSVGCPAPDPELTAGPSCFMNRPTTGGDHVCRDADHPNGTGGACWQRMTQLLRQDVGLKLLADDEFDGPAPPASPAIAFSDQPAALDMGSRAQPLDSAAIDPVIAAHGTALGNCLIASGHSGAKVRFVIRGQDGRVVRVEVDGVTTGELPDCVRQVMRRMRFPTGAATTTADFRLSR